MIRTAAFVLASAVVATGGGCRHAGSSDSSTPLWAPPEEPPPEASESCYRERFVVRGKDFEMRLRLRFEPDAGRITQMVSEVGTNGDARGRRSQQHRTRGGPHLGRRGGSAHRRAATHVG